ncbi:MAG: glycogen synthase GlgA [Nitrospirota bacterium]
MKILFAASEVSPFAKTGGLADVAGSLPPALASLGHDIRVVMPRYRRVDSDRFQLKPAGTFQVPLGVWTERCDVFESSMNQNVPVLFIGKDVYFDRPELYGTSRADYADNAERFIFFSRAVLECCRFFDFHPDIIHCNDWQAGLVPIFLNRMYRNNPGLQKTKTVFTIHNMGYQGLFPKEAMALTGLGWDLFTPEGLEFWGNMNFLKAGIMYADMITTVSKTYSREIQTPEYGCGLEGVLRNRSHKLHGIMNGIDYHAWDPSCDPDIPKHFDSADLNGKNDCRAALENLTGLPKSDKPIIGMVTRLADQKGLDILVQALPRIMKLDATLIMLGTGDELYHTMLAEAARTYAQRLQVILEYNDEIAKMIYAGSDMFLMPSRYEPCGLGQMIALRYGSVPIVRKTGGLADTIEEYDPQTRQGTGFLFDEYSSDALIACIKRAITLYHNHAAWESLRQNGMNRDFSWERSAREYEQLYQGTIAA